MPMEERDSVLARLARSAATLLLVIVASLLLPTEVLAQQTTDGPRLVIYNQDLALVQETLTLELSAGVNRVGHANAADGIDPTSVLLSPTAAEELEILERSFEPALGSDRLLEAYTGRELRLVTRESNTMEGTLLSSDTDIVLRREDGSVAMLPRDAIRTLLFPDLPEGLRARPTLTWRIRAPEGGSTPATLTYLTSGLSWRADYDLLLGPDERAVDLTGSMTIENRSGTDFSDARLTLVAGEIHTVDDDGPRAFAELEVARVAGDDASPVTSRPLSEYHRYEVPWPVTLRDRGTTGIEFVSAAGIPVTRRFTYDAATVPRFPVAEPLTDPRHGQTDTTRRVQVTLRFSTDEDGGVGARLPAGRARIYSQGDEGRRFLLGEDRVEHTPVGERVGVRMGTAFDLVGERVRVEHERLGDYGLEETYRITLRNHREDEVEIRVVEHPFRWSNWTITGEELNGDPAEHRVLDSDTIEWRVPVPAGGESVLTYSIRYTWR